MSALEGQVVCARDKPRRTKNEKRKIQQIVAVCTWHHVHFYSSSTVWIWTLSDKLNQCNLGLAVVQIPTVTVRTERKKMHGKSPVHRVLLANVLKFILLMVDDRKISFLMHLCDFITTYYMYSVHVREISIGSTNIRQYICHYVYSRGKLQNLLFFSLQNRWK